MSFRCDRCRSVSQPKVSPIRVVTETRPRTYPARYNRKGEEIVPETYGSEIVKEESLCGHCAANVKEVS